MKNIRLRLYNLLYRRALYIIADQRDSSVTLSRRVCKHMDVFRLESAKVFVFKIPSSGTYGFTINPDIKQKTQMADIQYNTKYKAIGFETLTPTVARIFYDYGIRPARVKLSVRVRHAPGGMVYYEIMNPNAESVRKK